MFNARSLIPAAAFLALAATAEAERPRLPRENLLVHRGDDGAEAPVRSLADWNERRAEIVRGVESVTGRLPGPEKRVPLEPTVVEEFDGGSYVRRKLLYTSEPGSRTPAYLLIPKSALAEGAKPVPAVLCLHGTNDVIGAGSVVGVDNVPNRQYARELAERGYVTLAPFYTLQAEYRPDLAKLGWDSGTLKAVWDNMRGIDLLQSLPYVRPDAIGAIGHSLGGHNAVFTAFFDDRIKVVVSSCGLDSFLDYKGGDPAVWLPEKGWCQTRYMRKLAGYRGRLEEIPFDFHELVAGLAPRPTLIVAPLRDSNFQWESVDRIAAAARPVFALHGAADRLEVVHPDCAHDFPEPMRLRAYELFDRELGKP